MKITFVWKSPVLNAYSIADVIREIDKRLENLSLDWEFDPKSQSESQRVSVSIETWSHREALRAIYRLSDPIHNGSIQLINDRALIEY